MFSQFAEMGAILQRHVQETYGLETPFLHGGVTRKQRDRMVQRFENDSDGPQVFVLSLKAAAPASTCPGPTTWSITTGGGTQPWRTRPPTGPSA